MLAKDIMTSPVVTVGTKMPVTEVARQLVARRISAVPVVGDDGCIVGIVSEGDLMRRPESETERHPAWWLVLLASSEDRAEEYVKTHGMCAEDVMTRNVMTVSGDTPVGEIATLLERNHIKRVPVVEGGRLVGIVSRANLLHGLVAMEAGPVAKANDAAVRSAVMQAVKAAGVVDTFVDVTVVGGTVHLWGAVYSTAERDALRVAAEQVNGVSHIEDHVSVLPGIVQSTLWAE